MNPIGGLLVQIGSEDKIIDWNVGIDIAALIFHWIDLMLIDILAVI